MPPTTTGPAPAGSQPLQPNIKVDVTFSDTLSGDTPVRKTVSMLVYGGGRHSGRIRAVGTNGGVINIDAVPSLQGDGIYIALTIEYVPEVAVAAGQPQPRYGALSQSLSVALPPGKPVIVTQSADPGSNRRVTVEVTATVVR